MFCFTVQYCTLYQGFIAINFLSWQVRGVQVSSRTTPRNKYSYPEYRHLCHQALRANPPHPLLIHLQKKKRCLALILYPVGSSSFYLFCLYGFRSNIKLQTLKTAIAPYPRADGRVQQWGVPGSLDTIPKSDLCTVRVTEMGNELYGAEWTRR